MRLRTTRFVLLAIVALPALTASATAASPPPAKVTICHHTKGQDRTHWVTLVVAANAAAAHFRNQGDTPGACGPTAAPTHAENKGATTPAKTTPAKDAPAPAHIADGTPSPIADASEPDAPKPSGSGHDPSPGNGNPNTNANAQPKADADKSDKGDANPSAAGSNNGNGHPNPNANGNGKPKAP